MTPALRHIAYHLAVALAVLLFTPITAAAERLPLERIKLPPGFSIEVFARVPKARSMVVMDDWGVVLVGSRGAVIHAVIDDTKDGKPDRVIRLFDNLKVANGIAWRDGWFYIAEQHRLVRYRAPDFETLAQAKPEVLFEQFPDDPWHGWRYARFGPDGALYVAIGAPCNICQVEGLEGAIVRFRAPHWRAEVYATGVRNSVGFDFHPRSGDLYFTDNGADNMGDDSPPDELNHAPSAGLWFGYPWFGGGDHRTPDFIDQPLPRKPNFPVVAFGAHVASLGISFYTGSRFPMSYQGDAFVAHHGSWNRTVPDGYRVARVRFDKKTRRATGWQPFAEGWLDKDGSSWGRPVDVKPTANGDLLISDDRAGAIYRIRYRP
jgi:glucose/arabinose dehydrogenase